MATIMDVARHAGVSMKTVSRVLNAEAHVSHALRDRVNLSVLKLGYRPNLAARQLAGQKSFIIAYPFNNPSAAYITDVLMGAAQACRDRGYHLVSEPIEAGPGMFEVIKRLVVALRPDGMILTPPLCDMTEMVDFVAGLNVPLVRIAGGRDLYGEAIVIDDRPICRAMVNHLVAQGHRRIAFVRPPANHCAAQARFDGYVDGLQDAGIPLESALIRPGEFDVASGGDAATFLLELPRPPTAIFAANDDMALGALQVAHSKGLSIPRDIAIAGFDDSPASCLAYPALTTVRQPTQELGGRAVALLLGNQVGPDAVNHVLVLRGSTLTSAVKRWPAHC